MCNGTSSTLKNGASTCLTPDDAFLDACGQPTPPPRRGDDAAEHGEVVEQGSGRWEPARAAGELSSPIGGQHGLLVGGIKGQARRLPAGLVRMELSIQEEDSA
eukprot:scaffold65587_cov19-Tisochrysis_lutea.AAC.1